MPKTDELLDTELVWFGSAKDLTNGDKGEVDEIDLKTQFDEP